LFPIKYSFRLFLRDRLTLHRWTSVETLHYSAIMIFTWFSLLMSAFSLLISPIFLTKYILRLQNVLLPNKAIWLYSHRFGNILETRYIFSDSKLDQWALTLSSKDGCFQAHLLVVLARKSILKYFLYHLFPLSICLGTLTCGLGFFPLDFGPLRPKSVCL